MTMAEKLNTLFVLSNISNAKLARALHVDSSLVSRWRSGTRPVAGNTGLVSQLSLHFAQFLTAPHQTRLLEHLLAQDAGLSLAELGTQEALRQWLSEPSGDSAVARTKTQAGAPPVAPPAWTNAGAGSTGLTGRLLALGQMLERWLVRPGEGELIIYCDEDREWVDQVTEYFATFLARHPELAHQLDNVHLIIPTNLSAGELLSVVYLTLPFLDTSLFQVHCHERDRPDTIRGFAALLRGVGAVTSACFPGSDPVSVFHTEEGYLRQLYRGLTALMTNSAPQLKRYDRISFAEDIRNRLEFLRYPDEMVYLGNAAPYGLLPEEALCELTGIHQGVYDRVDEARRRAREYLRAFEQNLGDYRILCCLPLYSPSEVERGDVELPNMPRFIGKNPVVTRSLYLSMLERTRYLMERYPNFHFQVIGKLPHGYCAAFKPGYRLYITTNRTHYTGYSASLALLLQAQSHSILSLYMSIPEARRTRAHNLDLVNRQIDAFRRPEPHGPPPGPPNGERPAPST